MLPRIFLLKTDSELKELVCDTADCCLVLSGYKLLSWEDFRVAQLIFRNTQGGRAGGI